MRTPVTDILINREKYLERRPHRPKFNRPHLAQELKEISHPGPADISNDVVRGCTDHAAMCACGEVSMGYAIRKGLAAS